MNAEPTDAQIDLACDVVIAGLSKNAMEAACLIAAHDARIDEEYAARLKRALLLAVPPAPPSNVQITYTESVHHRAALTQLHQAEADVDLLLEAIRDGLPKIQNAGQKPTNIPELVPFEKLESSGKSPEETVS